MKINKAILGRYKNGNYMVTIYEDGTKIRENNSNHLTPAFAESCDLKITNKCNGGCKYCYEGCTEKGEHSDVLSYPFLNSLHPHTELAINGNDLTHPQLAKFLSNMKKKKIIVNMTINQKHFMENYNTISYLVKNKLIHGLGVSLTTPTDDFIDKLTALPNTVLHVIAGILTMDDVEKLKNKNIKLLILGYKNKGRGTDYWNGNKEDILHQINLLKDNIQNMLPLFPVISFDNLALEQLHVRRLFETDRKWEEFYMGDDGDYTFYIDAVKGTFAKNSVYEEQFPIGELTVDQMFQKIRSIYGNN